MVHAANSAGVLFHPESWFDAVRPGVALYGINPSSNWQDPELEARAFIQEQCVADQEVFPLGAH